MANGNIIEINLFKTNIIVYKKMKQVNCLFLKNKILNDFIKINKK